MIGRTNATIGSGKDSVSLKTKPNITYDGDWLQWHIEMYSDVPYWEAWFLSSGVLTVNEPYIADAWGIGGGGCPNRTDTGYRMGGCAGTPNMATNIQLTAGNVAITIGAGGMYDSQGNMYSGENGGATSIGSWMSCAGGNYSFDGTQSDASKRNRFYDVSKNEAGHGGRAGDGWLQFVPQMNDYGEHASINYATAGHGFGGGALPCNTSGGRGAQGALVIRIPI